MQIHLIAFDIPFPADYGGVIDVFYKLKNLYEKGFQITLHCFQYKDRQPSVFLEHFCKKVYYYQRPLGLKYFFNTSPYIVYTRSHKSLLDNLLKDNNTIFFEGLHCTFFYNHPALEGRRKVIRMHNIEWKYYAHLAVLEGNFFKKIFFQIESWKLKYYEKSLSKNIDENTQILCISPADYAYFNNAKIKNCKILAPFHPFNSIEIQNGKGTYVLFHGNLSISDNEKSALFLIENVFTKSNYHLKIAGKNPSLTLKKIVQKHQNIELIENPNENEMKLLIQNAHVNLLWSMQAEGIKLKLFYALFIGRFIIANTNIIENTGLETLVNQANDSQTIIQTLDFLFSKEFDEHLITMRKEVLIQQLNQQNQILYDSLLPNSIV